MTTKDESTWKRTIKETPLIDNVTSWIKNTTEKVIWSDTVKWLLWTTDYISWYSTWKEIRNKLKEARWEKEAWKIEKAFIWMTYIPVVNSIIDRLIQDTNLPEKERASTKALLSETIVDIWLKWLMSTPTPFIAWSAFWWLTWVWEDIGLWTKTWLEWWREKYEKYVQKQLQEELWLNEWDAQSIWKTFTTSIDLWLWVVWAKTWWKIKSKPTSILTEWSIQSAQDIWAWLAFNEDNIKWWTSAAAINIWISWLWKNKWKQQKTTLTEVIKEQPNNEQKQYTELDRIFWRGKTPVSLLEQAPLIKPLDLSIANKWDILMTEWVKVKVIEPIDE